MPENPAPPPSNPPSGDSQARTWNMLCHLSALAGLIIPLFGNILGPLVVWQIKKHEIPSVEAHGKAAMNFQITITIVLVVGSIAAMLLSAVMCIGLLFIPVMIAVGLCGIIFPIIAGIKANDGKDYRYPYSLQLLK